VYFGPEAVVVADTMYEPATEPAVKRPFESIVPPVALHVTPTVTVEPSHCCPTAENCCVWPTATDAPVAGVMSTACKWREPLQFPIDVRSLAHEVVAVIYVVCGVLVDLAAGVGISRPQKHRGEQLCVDGTVEAEQSAEGLQDTAPDRSGTFMVLSEFSRNARGHDLSLPRMSGELPAVALASAPLYSGRFR
jgi:hypothetical protein